jgi:hypothetical protein
VSFGNLGNWIYEQRKETRPLVTEGAQSRALAGAGDEGLA